MNRFTGRPSEVSPSEPPEYYLTDREIDALTYTEEELWEMWKIEHGINDNE